MDALALKGKLGFEHWRDGEIIEQFDFSNGITNEGKNKLLDVMFHNVNAIDTWYIGLIDGNVAATLAAADTYARINTANNGWVEFEDYDVAARQAWVEAAASSQSITSSAAATFTITAGGIVYDAFVVGGGTTPAVLGDAAGGGTLWATGQLTSPRTVSVNDQLKFTYTVTC
jgi:hypothetical protein